MQFENNRAKDLGGEPSLTEMTEKAIDVLSRNNDDKGYFLLIEGAVAFLLFVPTVLCVFELDNLHHAVCS